jgi:hypothetical protein
MKNGRDEGKTKIERDVKEGDKNTAYFLQKPVRGKEKRSFPTLKMGIIF